MVACNLDKLLEKAELTQVEFAHRLKMRADTLNRICRGRFAPNLTLAVRIARMLGVEIASIWPDAKMTHAPKRH